MNEKLYTEVKENRKRLIIAYNKLMIEAANDAIDRGARNISDRYYIKLFEAKSQIDEANQNLHDMVWRS